MGKGAGDDAKKPPAGDSDGSGRVEATADDLEDPHFRLLYALSRYATAAVEETDDEGWIREVPLNVMIFEGVRAGALDFDYAPCSSTVAITFYRTIIGGPQTTNLIKGCMQAFIRARRQWARQTCSATFFDCFIKFFYEWVLCTEQVEGMG